MSATSVDEVAAAALAGLPGVGRGALRALWLDHGSPRRALDAVLDGRAGEALLRWADLDRWPQRNRPEVVGARMAHLGVRVLLPGDADWPVPIDLLEPPALLFVRGDNYEALHRPAVAIVGTRAASPQGLADAHEFAACAAHAGYVVVSGLALGIDAAAHRGALDARGLTIGVVATGPDITYPRRHDLLHEAVRHSGLTLGEESFGAGPAQWRFPVRNRLIVASSLAVLVVEARETGGALDTAKHAALSGTPLLAVPGSRRNPAAVGTNALIRDGATPVLDPSDLFTALDRARAARPRHPTHAAPAPCTSSAHGPRAAGADTHSVGTADASPAARKVLDACFGDAASIDDLVSRTGLSPGAVSGALHELERARAVERRHGQVWPL